MLLDFDGEQVEINDHECWQLSTTWNSADPGGPVNWPVTTVDIFPSGRFVVSRPQPTRRLTRHNACEPAAAPVPENVRVVAVAC